MRRTTVYCSSCSQVVLVYLHAFRRNNLEVCAAAKNCKKITKKSYFGDSKSFKVINVDTTRKLVSRHQCLYAKQHGCAYKPMQPFSR